MVGVTVKSQLQVVVLVALYVELARITFTIAKGVGLASSSSPFFPSPAPKSLWDAISAETFLAETRSR